MRISDWSSDVCSSDLEESENSDLAAAEERCRALQLRFGEQVGLVHGRMKGPAKAAVMARFAAGAIAVQIGRASCRDRVCQYVSVSVVGGSLKTKSPQYAHAFHAKSSSRNTLRS